MNKQGYIKLSLIFFIISIGLLVVGILAKLKLDDIKNENLNNARLMEEGHPMGGRFADESESRNLLIILIISCVGFATTLYLASSLYHKDKLMAAKSNEHHGDRNRCVR